MQNSELIRAISLSLSAGQKVYKFSELRDLLAKEGVDVSNLNLRRKNDQQALLGITEKYFYDLERERRIQEEIQEFEDAINDESDYTPLTYAWQFVHASAYEGVDSSEDCFLYPTTPLTCDVLSGQYCELAVLNKRLVEFDPRSTNERSEVEVKPIDKKSDNFYTPQMIIDCVVQCLGGIDLDPCADRNKLVPAQNHYTFEDDGLSKEWYGRVFMNPPYSNPRVWVNKLQQEYERGQMKEAIRPSGVSEAIALLPASTDTKWLSPLLRNNLVCFWKGRIRFIDGATYQPAKHSARESHVLIYWGNRFKRFINVFQDVASFPNVQLLEDFRVHEKVLPRALRRTTKLNRSKSTVSNKGFVQINPIKVKSAGIPMPYIGEVTGYHPSNQEINWVDLDDLTDRLEVAFSPEFEKVKVHQVEPTNGKYEGQVRRAIRVESSTRIIERASDLGNWKAQKLYHEMIAHGTREAGIRDAVLVDGRVIPRDAEGNFLEDLAFVPRLAANDTTISNLLIDGWLLVENYLKYDSEGDVSDVTDLEMLVNLLVASVSGRKESIIKRCAAIEFFQGLYPSSNIDEINQLERFLTDLQTDDELYRILCLDMVSEIRKQSLIDPLKLPKQIRECTEIKEIIVSKASKNPNVRLINNWLHPLAETHKGIPGTNGEAHCNTWQFASMVCGAATGRAPNTNTEAGLQMMIDLNVISFPNSTALQRAKIDDSIYLQLLGSVKEAMDIKVQEAFNRE